MGVFVSKIRQWLYAAAFVACMAEGDGEPDDGGSDGGDSGDGDGNDPAPLPYGELPDTYWESNFGSDEVNPDHRPLRPEALEGINSDAELDELILAMGDEIYMTDEDLAAYGRAAQKKDEGNEDEEDDKDKDGKDKDGNSDDDDADVKQFVEASGLTVEQFQKLPEKTQEMLTDRHLAAQGQGGEEGAQQIADVQKKLTDATALLEAYRKDPTIRARIEEIETGGRHVARELPKFAGLDFEELKTDLDLSDDELAKVAAVVNQRVLLKAKEVLDHERGAWSRDQEQQQQKREAWSVITSVSEVTGDKRLAFPDTIKDAIPKETDIDPNSDAGRFVKWIRESDLTLPAIKKLGAKGLYAAYADATGWARERDETIARNERKSLLEKLRNPETARMTSMPQGKRPATPSSSTDLGEGLSEDALMEEVASGNLENLNRLCEIHQANPDMLERLSRIGDEGNRRRFERERRVDTGEGRSRGAKRRRAKRQAAEAA